MVSKEAKLRIQLNSAWVWNNLVYGREVLAVILYREYIRHLRVIDTPEDQIPTLTCFRSRLGKMEFIEKVKTSRGIKYKKVSLLDQHEEACNCLCDLGKRARKLMRRFKW